PLLSRRWPTTCLVPAYGRGSILDASSSHCRRRALTKERRLGWGSEAASGNSAAGGRVPSARDRVYLMLLYQDAGFLESGVESRMRFGVLSNPDSKGLWALAARAETSKRSVYLSHRRDHRF